MRLIGPPCVCGCCDAGRRGDDGLVGVDERRRRLGGRLRAQCTTRLTYTPTHTNTQQRQRRRPGATGCRSRRRHAPNALFVPTPAPGHVAAASGDCEARREHRGGAHGVDGVQGTCVCVGWMVEEGTGWRHQSCVRESVCGCEGGKGGEKEARGNSIDSHFSTHNLTERGWGQGPPSRRVALHHGPADGAVGDGTCCCRFLCLHACVCRGVVVDDVLLRASQSCASTHPSFHQPKYRTRPRRPSCPNNRPTTATPPPPPPPSPSCSPPPPKPPCAGRSHSHGSRTGGASGCCRRSRTSSAGW